MSVKKRCFGYCNDCNGRNPWKLVEDDCEEAEWEKIKKSDCGCRDIDTNFKPEFDKNFWSKKNDKKPWCDSWEKKKKCEKGPKGDKGDRGDKGQKGDKCANYVCTLVSVKNPQTELIIPELNGGNGTENIIPSNISIQAGDTVDFTNWTDIVTDALNLFDNATGTYTAPEDGDYQVSLVVNYETSVPLPTNTNLSEIPLIELYDVDSSNNILASLFPIINIIVPLPPPSSEEPPVNLPLAFVQSAGQVIINAVIPLVANQRIRVRANTNGLIYFPPVGISQILPPFPPRIDFSPENVDTTLTIYKIRNSPTITISCNN